MANGTFTTNGAGGTVVYGWLRKDSTGTRLQAEPPITIARGDTSAHTVLRDRWTPASSGSGQLVFSSPAYAAPSSSFTCRI